jgi:hypothetical protein
MIISAPPQADGLLAPDALSEERIIAAGDIPFIEGVLPPFATSI